MVKKALVILTACLVISLTFTGCVVKTTPLTSTPSDQEQITVAQTQDLFIEIDSVTTPIGKGYYATLIAQTLPNANCDITVYYKSGPSSAQGLYPKEADSKGSVSWSWKVGTRTTPGSWRIVVTATLDGDTVSQTTYFTVY
ncbi:hypothetical protein ES703_45648 [subsurface metagenome]